MPDTPAGRQITWVMTQFNGPISRNLDERFSQQFLAKSSEQDVRSALTQWKRDEFSDGPAVIQEVEDTSLGQIDVIVRGQVTDRFCRVRLSTDKWGRINSLALAALSNYTPGALADWSRISSRLSSLPGANALAAYEVSESNVIPVHTHRADVPQSIDSLAGLYIAGALAEQVAAGKAAWNEQMPIDDDFKSIMGGRMQLEPSDTEFPLSQYLSLMLAENDNTAFDHLLRRVGRPSVESYMAARCSVPQRNRPFLATMEYYRIKLGTDRSIPSRFGSGDEPARQMLLSAGGPIDKSIPSLSAAGNWRLPFEIERIGWFATADDICRLVAELDWTSRRPGMEPLANALRMSEALEPSERWASAAFKRGAEPGVLSMVWLLQRTDGRRFVLTILANNSERPVSQADIAEVAAAAIRHLGRHDAKK